jgi:hypothetical protein
LTAAGVEQVGLAGVLADVGAANGHGDDLGAGGIDGGRVSAKSLYLPVPTSKRERYALPAIVS